MLDKYKIQLIGLVVGALLGFCYWFFMGRDGNTNPVDKSPILSTIWGAIMGVIISILFKSSRQ